MRTSKNQAIDNTHPAVDPFVDPIRYLRSLGIEAYLVEIKPADLPSAA
jgi:hypothetical protein